jgi:hypothetical protein
MWSMANDGIPNQISDFGRNKQYGSLYANNYLIFGGGGASISRYNDFQNILRSNPCPQTSQGRTGQ